MLERAALFVTVLILGGATAASAAASTVAVERDGDGNTVVVYRGGTGPDHASIESATDQVVVRDESIVPGRGCVKRARRAVCDSAAVVRVIASPGDGDDVLLVRAAASRPVRVEGGPGDDSINSSSHGSETTPVRLHGGAGDDAIDGGPGRDRLAGGAGDDALDGGAGRDTVSGGKGLDVVQFGGQHTRSSARVEASLDGRGRDGIVGARDTVRADIEGVTSGYAATLSGNGGANLVAGSRYDDRLTGRGGVDTLDGNAGDDLIDARDGRMDFVGCGGGVDTAYVDRVDDISSACEHVRFRRAPRGR